MIMPIPLAMILCDHVIIDKRTEKKSLIGIFSNMVTSAFPFRAPHFSIYISLTDGHGKYDGRLICSNREGRDIFEARGEIRFPGGAKTVVEMVYDIGGLMFPEKGIYNFAFYCGNEIIISRECRVDLIKDIKPGGKA